MARKSKPVLWGNETPESVRAHTADDFAWENFTPSWVPGFDEFQKANEIAACRTMSRSAKERIYSQLGAGPKKLAIFPKWVRVTSPDGGRSYNANIDLTSWRRLGYRPATVEILEAAGMRLPDTAYVDADGTIRCEDTALWYVDAERHERNRRERARFNAEFHAFKDIETGDPESPFIEVEEHEHHKQLTLAQVKDT